MAATNSEKQKDAHNYNKNRRSSCIKEHDDMLEKELDFVFRAVFNMLFTASGLRRLALFPFNWNLSRTDNNYLPKIPQANYF